MSDCTVSHVSDPTRYGGGGKGDVARTAVVPCSIHTAPYRIMTLLPQQQQQQPQLLPQQQLSSSSPLPLVCDTSSSLLYRYSDGENDAARRAGAHCIVSRRTRRPNCTAQKLQYPFVVLLLMMMMVWCQCRTPRDESRGPAVMAFLPSGSIATPRHCTRNTFTPCTVLQDVMQSPSSSTSSSSTGSSTSYYNNDPMNNRHSASDWLYNVRSLPESKVLREIRNPVLSVFVWSLFVSVMYTSFQNSSIRICRVIATNMCIPGTAHSFLVSALGLLLVFRTNSAYQRFNEGRKIWEHILSVSRNLSRFLSLYDREIGYEKQRRMMNLVAAYPYLLRQHIRPGCLCSNNSQIIPPEFRLLLKEQRRTQHETRHEGPQQHSSRTASSSFYSKNTNQQRIKSEENDDDNDNDFLLVTENNNRNSHNRNTNNDDSISLFGKKLQLTNTQQQQTVQPTNTDVDCWVDRRALPWSLFIPQSLPAISTAENRPLWVCDRMAALICKVPYGPNFTSRERLVLLGMVDKLTNAIGQCERIHQTAVPLNYARHSLRSLTLWLFTLPFALVQDLGLLTAFANAVIAWLFFGVYQIGYSIEDPFQGSLRLSILCDAIRRSVIREPSKTYADEDPNSATAAYSPEECLNLYASSKDGSIPEECLLYNNIPSLTDVIRRSVKTEESMSLSIEETMILQQKEKLLLQQQLSAKIQQQQQQQDQTHGNDTSSTSTLNHTKVPSSGASSELPPTTKTVWSLDEEMLARPKIVTYNKNGNWTEIGI